MAVIVLTLCVNQSSSDGSEKKLFKVKNYSQNLDVSMKALTKLKVSPIDNKLVVTSKGHQDLWNRCNIHDLDWKN